MNAAKSVFLSVKESLKHKKCLESMDTMTNHSLLCVCVCVHGRITGGCKVTFLTS